MDSVKYQHIPGFVGMIRDYSARALNDNIVFDCRNVLFKDGKIVRRWGCSRVSRGGNLGSAVIGVSFFQKLNSDEAHILVATDRDIFELSQASGAFATLLESYNTGTVAFTSSGAGYSNITGAAVVWDVGWPTYYAIVFDTNDTGEVNNSESVTLTSGSETFVSAKQYSMGTILYSSYLPEGTRVVGQIGANVYMSNAATATHTGLVMYSRPSWPIDVQTGVTLRAYCDKTGTIDITSTTGSAIVNCDAGFNTADLVPGLTMDHSGTEYTVKRVIDEYSFETTAVIAAGASGLAVWFYPKPLTANYVIRFCINSSPDSPMSFAYPFYDSDNDVIAVIANIDNPVYKWDGTGTVTALLGSPDPARLSGFFGGALFEHLVLANVYDTVGGVYKHHRINVSDAGDPESWGNAYYDLYQTNRPIVAIEMLGNRLVVYKEGSISHVFANPNGDNADPFDIEQDVEPTKGAVAGRSVVSFGTFHIFLGENNIYIYNGMNAIPIGDQIFDDLKKDYNSTYKHRCIAFPIYDENLYVLGIPTAGEEFPKKFYVYNYSAQAWAIWTFPFGVCSYAYGERNYSPTFADLNVTPVEEMIVRWCDLGYSRRWTHYLGGDDGHLYEFSPIYDDDDGSPIVASFETKDYFFDDPIHTKKLLENGCGLVGYPGQITIQASSDSGDTWSDPITLNMNGGSFVRAMAKFFMRGPMFRFKVANVNGAMFEFESMNIGFTTEGGLKRG